MVIADWGGTKHGRNCVSCLLRRGRPLLNWYRRLAVPGSRIFTRTETCAATPSTLTTKTCFGFEFLEPKLFTPICDRKC